MISQILDFLIALPKIADMVMSIVSQIVGWYVSKQTNDTLSQIADAAAFAANAETDEQRFQAAEKWQTALHRPRYLP